MPIDPRRSATPEGMEHACLQGESLNARQPLTPDDFAAIDSRAEKSFSDLVEKLRENRASGRKELSQGLGMSTRAQAERIREAGR